MWMHNRGLRLKKYEGSAQMNAARVVRAADSGPKTDWLMVYAVVADAIFWCKLGILK
jgi:hypothetical protein